MWEWGCLLTEYIHAGESLSASPYVVAKLAQLVVGYLQFYVEIDFFIGLNVIFQFTTTHHNSSVPREEDVSTVLL